MELAPAADAASALLERALACARAGDLAGLAASDAQLAARASAAGAASVPRDPVQMAAAELAATAFHGRLAQWPPAVFAGLVACFARVLGPLPLAQQLALFASTLFYAGFGPEEIAALHAHGWLPPRPVALWQLRACAMPAFAALAAHVACTRAELYRATALNPESLAALPADIKGFRRPASILESQADTGSPEVFWHLRSAFDVDWAGCAQVHLQFGRRLCCSSFDARWLPVLWQLGAPPVFFGTHFKSILEHIRALSAPEMAAALAAADAAGVLDAAVAHDAAAASASDADSQRTSRELGACVRALARAQSAAGIRARMLRRLLFRVACVVMPEELPAARNQAAAALAETLPALRVHLETEAGLLAAAAAAAAAGRLGWDTFLITGGAPRDDVGKGTTAKSEDGSRGKGERKEQRKKFLGIF